MNIAVFLRDNLPSVPIPIGKTINRIPFSYRPGIRKIYRKRRNEILSLDTSDVSIRKAFIYDKIKNLVDFSYHNIDFYREYYDSKNFHPSKLKRFEDISHIPVVNKQLLNEYSLDQRSFNRPNMYIVNTGGSSGTPFGFYIEPSSMGHEWAHMHTIWETLGYKSYDLKLTFGGRSNVDGLIEYDVVRNQLSLDIYADYEQVCLKLLEIVKKHNVKYLHGYPSSIYDFTLYCERNEPELTQVLRKSLVGAFLGSEYPHEKYRDKIEEVFDIKTISWYGHTERTILACEKEEKFKYYPFQTYGYTEAVNINDSYHLIGTSYYNFASPLIRYDTGDTVTSPLWNDDILESFKILDGRSGEFVIDKNGKKISLTGLIFGRHHELFNYSEFIQVHQIKKGVIEILYVSDSIKEVDAQKFFDSANMNLDISFKRLDAPVRTVSGKVNLLVKEL